MRAVLDTNVLVSALISSSGTPGVLVREWLDGAFELVASPRLLAELERAASYPKVRATVRSEELADLLADLRTSSELRADGVATPVRVPDPDDRFVVALAYEAGAVLVTGDRALLGVDAALPIVSPADFRQMLRDGLPRALARFTRPDADTRVRVRGRAR